VHPGAGEVRPAVGSPRHLGGQFNGERALSFMVAAALGGPCPQLFVLDLNLPKVDGLTLLRQLRESVSPRL
jgi:DNA-binding response OmpR family regulator